MPHQQKLSICQHPALRAAAEARVELSIASKGDGCDKAMTETIHELREAEPTYRHGHEKQMTL